MSFENHRFNIVLKQSSWQFLDTAEHWCGLDEVTDDQIVYSAMTLLLYALSPWYERNAYTAFWRLIGPSKNCHESAAIARVMSVHRTKRNQMSSRTMGQS